MDVPRKDSSLDLEWERSSLGLTTHLYLVLTNECFVCSLFLSHTRARYNTDFLGEIHSALGGLTVERQSPQKCIKHYATFLTNNKFPTVHAPCLK